MQLSEGNIKLVFQSVGHLPNVRDLCVEQNMTATVSAGVKPELFLVAKEKSVLQIKSIFKTSSIKCSTYLCANIPLIDPAFFKQELVGLSGKLKLGFAKF